MSHCESTETCSRKHINADEAKDTHKKVYKVDRRESLKKHMNHGAPESLVRCFPYAAGGPMSVVLRHDRNEKGMDVTFRV